LENQQAFRSERGEAASVALKKLFSLKEISKNHDYRRIKHYPKKSLWFSVANFF
jgi:hypothetical protein